MTQIIGRLLSYIRIFLSSSKIYRTCWPIAIISFELYDQVSMAINAGSEFKFSESIMLMIPCGNQEESEL